MTARGRGPNQDWDLEYDNSNYDPQNPDDSSSGYVNLDHCRLYITNIPRGLNDDGLAAAFSKYGNLVECYVSPDQDKRYGLVSFETPGEAKAAMMKLNRTEPLNLYVNIAYKSKAKKTDKSGYRGGNSSGARYRDDRGFRDDGSTGNRSNSRRQDFMANGDSMDDLVGDNGVLNSSMEPDVNLELEQLKLQHLKLQEEQLLCKQRMLLLKQTERKPSSSTRCIMPDGRIVVRSVDQGEADADGNYGAGAGDANKIPGLQSCGACVACGVRAESFCSGCRVTPYCSAACQRRDWSGRHHRVCHNLRRQSGEAVASRPEPEPVPIIPAPAPLRRPRSPESSSDRLPPRRFGPPGSAITPTPVARAAARGPQQPDSRGRPQRTNDGDSGKFNARPSDRNDRDRNDRDRNDRDRNDRDRNQDNRNSGRNNTSYDRPRNQSGGNRQPRPSGSADNRPQEQDEDWGPAPAQKPQDSMPAQVKSPPAQKAPAAEAEAKPRPKPAEASPAPVPSARPLATIADVAPVPARKLTPSNCVAELLSVDEQFFLSIDATGESCRSGPGWVCTVGVPAGRHADDYAQLLDPLAQACEAAEAFEPRPGDLFAYLDASEGAWYRARCLSPGLAALLDASRVVPLSSQDRRSRLPKAFADIPEYCCQLESGKVKIGDTLECTVVSKTGGKLSVSMSMEGAPVGTAAVRRWLPEVEPPPAASTATKAAASTEQLQVPRPAVRDNSTVVLLDATEPSRVFVKPAQPDKKREFNDLICEVEQYATDAAVPRLKELPVQGQTVIARFTDDVHYRVFVKRVSSKHKRCLLEYIEYGNVEIEDNLENLCACPPELDLSARPTLTSMVTLEMKQKAFTDPAKEYLNTIKEEVDLKLTIPSGADSAPSGTAVRLTVVKSGEDVNRKMDTLCTPEWQRLLERGGDVLEIETLYFNVVEYVDPPPSGELEIYVDSSMLTSGTVYGHARQAPHAQRAFALASRLEEYCNSALAKDPYLPKQEELCIARCPKRKQWVRAVLLEQTDGPGSSTGEVLLFDFGELRSLPVAALRKMLPEFVRGLPAACSCFEIKDFPPKVSSELLERAKRHMQINEHGAGVLKYTRCTRQDVGEYCVEAPDLIRALQ